MGHKIGQLYRALSENDKGKWVKLAEDDKLRYNAEMVNYVPSPAPASVVEGPRWAKDPDAPKRPMSAFFRYCATRRATLQAQNPGKRAGDIAKILGEEWCAAAVIIFRACFHSASLLSTGVVCPTK